MMPGGTSIFGLIALALAGTIAFEFTVPNSRPVDSFIAPVHVSNATPPSWTPPSRIDIDSRLAEILARPLFNPDRRPVAVGARSVTGLSRLTGIVVTGSHKIAIFAGQSDGPPVIAEEGSHLNAFEVTSISENGVTVVGPGGRTVMTPIFDLASPTIPRPPGTARPEPPRATKKKP